MSAAPAARPFHRVTISRRAAGRAGSAIWAQVVARAVVFGAMASTTYFASSMLGQVKLEEARREGLWARERLRQANHSVSALERRIDEMTRLASVRKWALASGFVAPDRAVRPSTPGTYGGLVARK